MTEARRKITDEERRARLGARHLLAPTARASTPEAVAEALLGLHATDPASVYLSVAARLQDPSVTELERALYEDHTLVRMLCMRRTMFVVPRELAPVVDASTARAVAARERRNLAKVIQEQLGFDERWFAATEAAVVAALQRRGEATASQIASDVPDLTSKIVQAAGKPYEARPRITSRFLGVMAAEGRIRRGRPLGTWASSQYRWIPAEPHPDLPVDEAKARLAARYLEAFGPATTEDVTWWTGWTLTDTRKALARTEAVEVDLDHGPGHALPAHLDAPAEPEPWVALLPALDPTPMGWRDRDWYFDAGHRSELFDTNGNIGPSVWCDGRVVGGWAQRSEGEIVTELLTPRGVGREALAAIADEAARLAAFFADVRVKPSFRTPLERRLTR
ncbi:winged helix DNA-binding domain-containing protein [Streptomyces sp. NBC_00083]|uniref:winged helix DNA-binding domain-containing protein n=1 Tax=Streptomyces sp. NBC_00083 TaxID=2975647 RepID=UPI002257BF0E|nr:winged helix DNA-binding domain-containing protein [Streptomyces sp. NBC_00083]MCX5387139.1 winged helix DNA-binding domain-containing protein [Streptomyces sp. NBC_00083]